MNTALVNIAELTTNNGATISDATVLMENGRVTYAGPGGDIETSGEVIDCTGRAVLPGFVDSHTHLVFAGDRSDEFRRRLEGESYSEISASGGGILSTVNATRQASEDHLFESAAQRVRRMIAGGTTSLEIKSGYGLDTESEVKMLRVARRIGEELPVTVKTTFLGAHSVPPEYGGDREGYTNHIIKEMMPEVEGLADFCDVFVETGVFDPHSARRIFAAGADHGMQARVHAEQLSHLGGAALAADIGAASADHLDHVTEEDAQLLASAGVVAVMVPGASFSLQDPQAPGPMLAEAGCVIALATDCNPGTSYYESMQPIISLGVLQMGLTVEQAIEAATLGGAISLGLEDRGVIREGAPADVLVLDAPSTAHIPYRPATNLVSTVFKDGIRVA